VRARTIDESEFVRVLEAAATTPHPARDAMILMLCGRAGMRIDEVRNLEVEDVWDGRTGAVRDRIHLPAHRTKSRLARDVHLNGEVRDSVRAYLAARIGEPTGKLVLTGRRKPFERTSLVHHVRKLFRLAGIETSSHAGRRLFIQSLADRHVSLRVIQAAVGHRSLASTNAYFDARPSEVAAAVGRLGR
jgi:integrase/recombinase XerD